MEQTAANSSENPDPQSKATEPSIEESAKSISDFLAQPEFPENVRGQAVNIGGYTGLVADIVGNSLKVRSPEGVTKSFNYHTLRKLYGPREEVKPMISSTRTEPQPAVTEVEEEEESPRRNVITNPNYDLPSKPIQAFTGRSDYPQCTLGEYVEIADYKGVVVEIVKGSLKVRSPEEVIRSYNSAVIKKLYPPS